MFKHQKTWTAVIFFVLNFLYIMFFDLNEESIKIFLCQMTAIICYALSLWCQEKFS